MSPANSLAFEDNPSDEWLIYIKNNNGPNTEPWVKSASQALANLTKPFVFYFSESYVKGFLNY